mgnify:CR=1 FL=1
MPGVYETAIAGITDPVGPTGIRTQAASRRSGTASRRRMGRMEGALGGERVRRETRG